jgi:hypothetical protein
MPVDVLTVIAEGSLLLTGILTVACLACAVIVLVKAFRNDQVALAVLGLFIPLVLFILGWVNVRDWRLGRTMLVWTLAAVVAPLLGAAGGLALGVALFQRETETATAPDGSVAAADPGNLQAYRGQAGRVLYFHVRGSTLGPVWGSDPYTDDSSLAAAAVHAGVLRAGERGVVRVTLLPGQGSYPASSRNGVNSGLWGSWSGSYRVESADAPPAPGKVPGALPDPGTLARYRNRVGQAFFFDVVGTAQGPVWGTDVYTDDSSLAAAAVHAGVLKAGQRGTVRVTILPGQGAYLGSVRHGVESGGWDAWDGSFRVEEVPDRQ